VLYLAVLVGFSFLRLGGDFKLQYEKLDYVPYLRGNSYVRVTESGNIIDVTYMEKRNDSQTVKLLGNGKMMIVSTGEIIDISNGENRLDYKSNLFRTFRRIRNLVNANVIDSEYCRWVTLTYAENMQDTKRLMRDFDSFRKRFQRYCVNKSIPIPDYIAVPEPQQRGAWHLHIIYIWHDVKAPYIENDVLRNIWGHGFVSIKALANVDNIGAYLCAYLGDLETDSPCGIEKEFLSDDGKPIKKNIIKGGRLSLYPANFNMIRHSQGIIQPNVYDCEFWDIKEKVSSAKETYSQAFQISDESFCSVIIRKQYNLCRKNSQ